MVWQVYKDDPAWVPPLKSEVHALLDPNKNPWFGHARAQLWLAERDGKVVGRTPVYWEGTTLVVATADPSNVVAVDDIRTVTRTDIRLVVSTRE